MIKFLDLKKINDSYGHAIGDQVLRQFSTIAQSVVRKGDLFARYGGEEFVLLIQNSNSQQAEQALQRLREAFKVQGISVAGEALYVTFSAGVSHVQGPTSVTLDMLLEAADRAMYQAKADGRDRISVVAEELCGDEQESLTVASPVQRLSQMR